MTVKSNLQRSKRRAMAIYAATKYGRHFLSGRFLKMSEKPNQKNMVFDKRASAFITVEDATIEHLMESPSFRKEIYAKSTNQKDVSPQYT